jgi:hypothetical protein
VQKWKNEKMKMEKWGHGKIMEKVKMGSDTNYFLEIGV